MVVYNPATDGLTQRDRLDNRVGALKTEQSDFRPHWKSLTDFIAPRRGRYELQDRNKGERRHSNIINGRAAKALGIATSGMFTGTMNPTQRWFVPEFPDDPELSDYEPVRLWAFQVGEIMRRIYLASNLYEMAPMMIREALLFGTGCMSDVADPLDLSRYYAHTIGSYYIAQDERMRVNTVAREFQMTVEQIVRKFARGGRGVDGRNISQYVRDQWNRGNYDTWVTVRQLVQPNDDFRPNSRLNRHFQYIGYYWEPENNEKDALLSVTGYNRFPFYVMRWELAGEDIYGTNCPGMTALGDVKQLQLEERRKAQGIEKMVSPVLQGPPSFKNTRFQNKPGFVASFDAGGDPKGLRPVYEVNLPLQHLMLDIKEVEARINEAFHVDLFKAITDMRGIQPRNQLELLQRDQERLLELGAVLQRMFYDFLGQHFDTTFERAQAVPDLLPPPPPEIENREIRPKFTSVLALAQQAAVTGSIDRVLGVAERLTPIKPDALDKLNGDAILEEYQKATGAPPSILFDDDQVAEVREQRAQAQEAAQNAEMGEAAARIARDASQAKLDDDNALSRATG